MTRLLLIRHAETDMAGTFCGHSNPPINAAGYRQIDQLANRLCTEPLEAVYTSDLQRASTTANAVAQKLGILCFHRPALREIDFGNWEGLRWEEIESSQPAVAAQWLQSFPQVAAPSGESFANFERRVLNEIAHLSSEANYESIAVVTHAGVMRVVLRRICGMSDSETWPLTSSYCAALWVSGSECTPIDRDTNPVALSRSSPLQQGTA